VIEGVKILADVSIGFYHMIEIGSWIGLAAMTRSEITIKDVSWDNLGVIPSTLKNWITLERG
jgi:UDP-N-acetylglucosamine 1-carboxyvinyltransferase